MTKKSIRAKRKPAFSTRSLHKKGDQPFAALTYLKHKSSFLVASLSLVAFIAGNMMGQHGWYAFWKAALGQYDDSLITYTGTVTPIAQVPDYSKWSAYGGSPELHTFRQVPRDVLMPLPTYDQRYQQQSYDERSRSDIYSVGHMGSYKTGADGGGSHIGVDIRVPEGTPVRSVMNGIVTRVAVDPGGFGKLIVIRHPHAPDPDDPRRATVLHSGYAHLSEQLVAEGDIVQKGQTIAYSGMTGYATGPHLHFQIDRDEAPWHPYWAFSYTEAREAGMNTAQAVNAGLHSARGYEYTVHPLLYVQANYAPPTIKDGINKTVVRAETKRMTPQERREERIAQRLAAHKQAQVVVRVPVTVPIPQAIPVVAPKSAPSPASPDIVQVETVATTQPVVTKPAAPSAKPVTSALIEHSGSFGEREWKDIKVTLLDANGSIADAAGLTGKLYMRTAFGEAEFEPAILEAKHFRNGTATVRMLPRGSITIVILIEPLKVMSKPMQFTGR
jgi:murein DD-endopeptidase MepM/ murein hydrolase activator NlpD